jgi:hypothetical protein
MNKNLNAKRRQLEEQLQDTELAASKIRAKLELIDEIENDEGPVPVSPASEIERLMQKSSIKMEDAVREAVRNLRHFTRYSLVDWITKNHPSLEFSPKSVGKPLQEMLKRGEVQMIKKNVGNKSPAVYAFKGKAAGA